MAVLNLFRHTSNSKTFSAGEIIFQIGEYGDEMYVVRTGEVAIQLGEQVIEVVEEGGILGEMVVINAPIRTATAVAITNCQLVPVKSEQFRFMAQETPHFAEWVRNVLARRIVKMCLLML